MKPTHPAHLTLLALATLLLLAPATTFAADSAKPAAKPTADTPAAKRHPLRGVITRVDTERSALMVKHEDIPGVMRAMTMLFKVDAATLKSSKEGQTITGLLSRQGANWVLEDVKVVSEKKS
ncbi:MAG: copper-binding protein [Verrucomicrobiota bacterium]